MINNEFKVLVALEKEGIVARQGLPSERSLSKGQRVSLFALSLKPIYITNMACECTLTHFWGKKFHNKNLIPFWNEVWHKYI